MSLFKQLFIAICVLMLVSFTGSFLVSVESSREQQVNQLRAHAQDAATALGLSLSPHVKDVAMMELMVSSIFDSGYFESIRVIDPANGQVIVERSGVPVSGEAPQWFANLVDLAPASGDAIVSDGWRQAARVQVVSHPLFAVGKLWQSALGVLLWLALSGLFCIGLGVLLLKRQLRPLDYMVEQSNAIARREFLSVPELPKTPEFRRVVNAMNQMVEKLKALFAEEAARSEKLRAEAYQDSLTGLANRRYFDLQLQARVGVDEHAGSGFVLLLRVNDLAGLKQTGASDCLPVAHVGMTAFAPGDQLAAIYAALDAALAQASSQSLQSWACSEHDAQRPAADERQSWHALLDQALNQGRFQLYVQPETP